MKDERKSKDGTLVVSTRTIKLIENNADAEGGKQTVFSLKYTIDHPALDISSNDTKMISLYYAEIENDFFDQSNQQESKSFSYDLEAMSRQSRDLIALSIRCFSAITCYKDSQVIQCLNRLHEFDDSSDDGNGMSPTKKGVKLTLIQKMQQELTTVNVDIGEQMEINERVTLERNNLTNEFDTLESEMELTIDSY